MALINAYKHRLAEGAFETLVSVADYETRVGAVDVVSGREARTYVPIYSFGPAKNIRLFVVGRNPGKDEDAYDPPAPFVGVSGRILFRWLEEVGVPLDQLAIGNLVAFHTRADREPSLREVGLTAPLLFEAIAKLPNLSVILLCGAQVIRTFGIHQPVTHVAGKFYSSPQGPYLVPSIHPGSIAYQSSNRVFATKIVAVMRKLLYDSAPDTPSAGSL